MELQLKIKIFEGISKEELEILDQIKMEDLNDDLQTLAERYGLDLIKDMMLNFGGFSFHFIKPISCKRAIKELIIEKLKHNVSLKKIAIDFKITEEYIKKIIQEDFNTMPINDN